MPKARADQWVPSPGPGFRVEREHACPVHGPVAEVQGLHRVVRATLTRPYNAIGSSQGAGPPNCRGVAASGRPTRAAHL
jgi:hypothetical protein